METHHYLQTGQYHIERREPCEDYACVCETKRFAAVIAADGATGCLHGKKGAETACRAVAGVIEAEGENFFSFPEEKIKYLMLEQILYCLEEEYGISGQELQEYGSTLLFACMDKRTGRTFLWNLGDGGIYGLTKGSMVTLLPPKRYRDAPCLTTTENARQAVESRVVNLTVGQSVLLCTDGMIGLLRSNLMFQKMGEMLRDGRWEELDEKISRLTYHDDCGYVFLKR